MAQHSHPATARQTEARDTRWSLSDNAEGMAGWVSENPRFGLVRLVIRLARTQFQQPGFDLLQVFLDLEADVKLLGNGLIGPARSPIVVDPLETDQESVLTVETRKVDVRPRVEFEAGGLLVERRQSQRVRAVEIYRAQLHLQGHGTSGRPMDFLSEDPRDARLGLNGIPLGALPRAVGAVQQKLALDSGYLDQDDSLAPAPDPN